MSKGVEKHKNEKKSEFIGCDVESPEESGEVLINLSENLDSMMLQEAHFSVSQQMKMHNLVVERVSQKKFMGFVRNKKFPENASARETCSLFGTSRTPSANPREFSSPNILMASESNLLSAHSGGIRHMKTASPKSVKEADFEDAEINQKEFKEELKENQGNDPPNQNNVEKPKNRQPNPEEPQVPEESLKEPLVEKALKAQGEITGDLLRKLTGGKTKQKEHNRRKTKRKKGKEANAASLK